MQPDEIQDGSKAPADAPTPLDPAHIQVLRIRTGLFAAALLAAAWMLDARLLGELGAPPLWAPGAAALIGLAALILFPGRRYRRWGYSEGEDEIEIRRGSILRVRSIVPFGRVQHIDVAQGPVQRPFGLATLILHTAGTHGASVPLPGLKQADAEALRDRIRAKIRQDLV